jgi:hypothetical protein
MINDDTNQGNGNGDIGGETNQGNGNGDIGDETNQGNGNGDIGGETNHGKESVILFGSVDCIDYKQKILYEFKVVDHIKDIHFIQLCLYMYLHKTKCKNDKLYKGYTKSSLDETEWLYVLYNIRSNEYFNLNFSLETCKSVFDILLKYKKNGIGGKCDDATFLETNKIFYLK